MSNVKNYCLIRDGVIVDYPVHEHYIRNRGHVVSMYTPVVYGPKPKITKYQYLEEVLTIAGDVVRGEYKVRRHDLQTILNIIHGVDHNELAEGEEVKRVAIKDVEPEAIEFVTESARELVQDRLDKWAMEREYDGILSVASYATSSNAKFRKEGQRAVELRDQSWEALYAYLTNVLTGQAPVPLLVEEIESLLPELTWLE